MTKLNPFILIVLTIVTLGIYNIVWLARARGEMNALGANIPTTWLIIVPLANLWYLWKWSQGVEVVTKGKMGSVIAFLLQFLLGVIGDAIIQDSFNNIDSSTPVAAA